MCGPPVCGLGVTVLLRYEVVGEVEDADVCEVAVMADDAVVFIEDWLVE